MAIQNAYFKSSAKINRAAEQPHQRFHSTTNKVKSQSIDLCSCTVVEVLGIKGLLKHYLRATCSEI